MGERKEEEGRFNENVLIPDNKHTIIFIWILHRSATTAVHHVSVLG